MLVAAVTFAVVLVTALGAWRWVGEHSLRAANSRFEQNTMHITADLQREFTSSESLLRGARGLLSVAPAADADAWRRYVAQLDLDEASSVVRTLGYAEVDAAAIARLTGGAANAAGPAAALATGRAGDPDGAGHRRCDACRLRPG